MTQAELTKHLDAAEKSPKQIAAAVSGLPEKTLRYKPAPDKWCILEILASFFLKRFSVKFSAASSWKRFSTRTLPDNSSSMACFVAWLGPNCSEV